MDERVRNEEETLVGVLAQTWAWLAQRVADPDNHAVLATVVRGEPDARTVVLRRLDVEARHLFINTDARSPKEGELERNPHVMIVVYDARERTQVRLRASAQLHFDDAVTREAWDALPFEVRRLYMTVAPPGTGAAGPTSGVSDNFERRAPDMPDDAAGYSHFAVIETTITHLDWLRFEAHGSRRAAFAWDERGCLRADWLYP